MISGDFAFSINSTEHEAYTDIQNIVVDLNDGIILKLLRIFDYTKSVASTRWRQNKEVTINKPF